LFLLFDNCATARLLLLAWIQWLSASLLGELLTDTDFRLATSLLFILRLIEVVVDIEGDGEFFVLQFVLLSSIIVTIEGVDGSIDVICLCLVLVFLIVETLV